MILIFCFQLQVLVVSGMRTFNGKDKHKYENTIEILRIRLLDSKISFHNTTPVYYWDVKIVFVAAFVWIKCFTNGRQQ